MLDPYLTLGIREAVDDDAVSMAYHSQLRVFPPETFPEEFARISAAYDLIRTQEDRLALRLFGAIPEVDDLAELAGGEPAEAFNTDKAHWVAAAAKSWLTRGDA